MGQAIESKNKTLVLEAFDALFHKRDCLLSVKHQSDGRLRCVSRWDNSGWLASLP